jgi:putative cell wall-binding protein
MELVHDGRHATAFRIGLVLGLLALLVAGLPAAAGAVPNPADADPPDADAGVALRIAGADRVGTSVSLSRSRDEAAAVVIARADAYPDALAGAPLAAALDAPVLLTGGERLDDRVAEEVRRLGASTAHLLGGEGALSAAVAEDLRAAGARTIEWLAGVDRYDTAGRVATAVVALTGVDRAYVVEGDHADVQRGWPDAVAVSGLAALEGSPIVLVTQASLPAATAAVLGGPAVASATIVGGDAAISPAVAGAISAAGVQVDRVSGATRYATSVALADRAVTAGADAAHLWLATGRNWPDALAAGPAVAADGGVLLLIDGRGLAGSPASRDWLAAASVDRAVVVGGTGAIRASTVREVERLSAANVDEVAVSVFFSRDDAEPGEVFALTRSVRRPGVLEGAIGALLAGPTATERGDGYWSWFSGATAGMLRGVRIEDGTAHLDFDDFSAIIPNAATSAGSASLLAELEATATQFPSVDSVRYAFAGDEDAFYHWLQLAPPR